MPAAPPKDQLDPAIFDTDLEPHILTDKSVTKLLPCVECRRACVVTTFMAPVKVKCKACKTDGDTSRGSQAVVQPGRTPPELAANLTDCLLNKSFAHAICPLDAEHTMELKDVSHSQYYGPRHLLGYKDGMPQYEQQIGETVMWQCLDCCTVVSFSTQHPRQMRRQNEPRQSIRTGPGVYESILGLRDE